MSQWLIKIRFMPNTVGDGRYDMPSFESMMSFLDNIWQYTKDNPYGLKGSYTAEIGICQVENGEIVRSKLFTNREDLYRTLKLWSVFT